MIKCSPVRFLVEDVQLAECAPESCYPVDGQLIPSFLLQVVENLHGCEPFAFFALLRATEMAKEKFFQWVYPLEFPTYLVMLEDFCPVYNGIPLNENSGWEQINEGIEVLINKVFQDEN